MLHHVVRVTVPKIIADTDSQLLHALEGGSEVIQDISDQFAPLMKKFHVYFFWEQQKTRLPHTREYVSSQRPSTQASLTSLRLLMKRPLRRYSTTRRGLVLMQIISTCANFRIVAPWAIEL